PRIISQLFLMTIVVLFNASGDESCNVSAPRLSFHHGDIRVTPKTKLPAAANGRQSLFLEVLH
ncbi:MAG TPA: hypothetical protein VFV38_44660, partial [Ktedonobacteraceae bacterium]|nr:hypothetical protein [Ktedonobacteraceae bacterium]